MAIKIACKYKYIALVPITQHEQKNVTISQLQHIPRNWKRYSTVCHSERVNWVPGSWVQMCSRIVIELLSPASLSLFPALSPPSPVAAYPWGPYLACVQSDGMLGKQQSTHGDVDAYAVPATRSASVVPESYSPVPGESIARSRDRESPRKNAKR